MLKESNHDSDGSSGLVVMVGDSCSYGRGFESSHWQILLTIKCIKSVLKDENRGREWPTYKEGLIWCPRFKHSTLHTTTAE